MSIKQFKLEEHGNLYELQHILESVDSLEPL